MCHQSPAVDAFASLMALAAVFVFTTHVWQFDRGKCLLFTRRDAFRFVLCWMMVAVVCGFLMFATSQTYVKYKVGYLPIPGHGIMPVPYQLWPARYVTLYRVSYWLLVFAWGCLVSLHLEEICYWAYMLRACQKSGSPHWFKTIWFKLWLVGSLVGFSALAGSCAISSDIQMMETHVFFAGSICSLALIGGSVWMCFIFPPFIEQARRLGANQEVLSRLLYMKVLNSVRAILRIMYSIDLVLLSSDGLTKAKKINTSHILSDTLFIVGYFAVFFSTVLSLWVLLPRKAPQAQAKQEYLQQAQPLVGGANNAYGRTDDAQTATAWSVLGDRLNIDRDQVLEANTNSILSPRDKDSDFGFMMDMPAGLNDQRATLKTKSKNTSGSGGRTRDLSFGKVEDGLGGGARHSEMPFQSLQGGYYDDIEMGRLKLPAELENFAGPLDVRPNSGPRDLRVMVHNEVVHDDY